MSSLTRKTVIRITAAALPFGMVAAFACQATAASAATARPAQVRQIQSVMTASAGLEAGLPAAKRARARARRQRLGRNAQTVRMRAYRWAAHQAGAAYMWGGTGPDFDCSGLVMMAYLHAGIRLPRTTTAMLASPLLVKVIHPRMGDLAFYGSGHVELFRRWGYTFGAHDSALPIGLIHYGWGWRPTAYYRVK